jgi:hypothetical protein
MMGGGSGGGGGESPARPPHWIRPDAVDAWLADSVNRRVTFHYTTREAAQEILEHGVDIRRSRIAAYGQGFYTLSVSDPSYGPVALEVAVRARQPLAGLATEIETQIDALAEAVPGYKGRITRAIAHELRAALVRLGYDSLILYDAGGDGVHYVVALHSDRVRVVRP